MKRHGPPGFHIACPSLRRHEQAAPALSWLPFTCDLRLQLRGYSCYDPYCTRESAPKGTRTITHTCGQNQHFLHAKVSSLSSAMLINYPSIAWKTEGPLECQAGWSSTTFITRQLAEADIIYTDSIPDRDNPSWQRLTAVWFPRHPVLKRQVDLFKFSFSGYMFTSPRKREGKKEKNILLMSSTQSPCLTYVYIIHLQISGMKGSRKTLPCI